jgi:hypothetical protein
MQTDFDASGFTHSGNNFASSAAWGTGVISKSTSLNKQLI